MAYAPGDAVGVRFLAGAEIAGRQAVEIGTFQQSPQLGQLAVAEREFAVAPARSVHEHAAIKSFTLKR